MEVEREACGREIPILVTLYLGLYSGLSPPSSHDITQDMHEKRRHRTIELDIAERAETYSNNSPIIEEEIKCRNQKLKTKKKNKHVPCNLRNSIESINQYENRSHNTSQINHGLTDKSLPLTPLSWKNSGCHLLICIIPWNSTSRKTTIYIHII